MSPSRFAVVSLATVLALALTVCPSLAQTAAIQAEVDGRLAAAWEKNATEATRQRYEEMEILGRLLDRALARATGRPGVHRVATLAISPDGKTLATQEDDGGVRLWDVGSGRQVPLVPPGGASAQAAADAWLRTPAMWRTFPARAGAAGQPRADMPQGYYLKGHGIVFTLTLPELSAIKAVGSPSRPEGSPLSEWERARRELRGEPADVTPPAKVGDVSLAEAVLKVLAENGKHLTALPEGESVTVAITLVPAPPTAAGSTVAAPGDRSSAAAPSPPGSTGASMMPTGMMRPNPYSTPTPAGNPGLAMSGGGPADGSFADVQAAATRQTLLGDLHLKQGQNLEAIDAYALAHADLARLLQLQRRRDLDLKGTVEPSDPAILFQLVQVQARRAQALQALGRTDEARQVLAGAADHARALAGPTAPATPAAAPAARPPALPARLLITAPKKLLDQAGTGKMTFEDFRRAATVEHLTFDPPAKPAPAKPAPAKPAPAKP